MKYVFFTFTLDGVTGGQRYVNNKVKWLQEKGYEVVVFDHRGGLSLEGNVVLEYLKPFQDNRYLELFFPPSYFTKKQRERIIDDICQRIGEADDYVIESNSGRLSFWGELVAQRIHAKHIILDVGEHPDIRNRKDYEFYSFKFDRNELLFINPQVAKSLFKGYRNISDEEAATHFYSAIMNVIPEDVPMLELEGLPEADFKILSFGREKPYFGKMIEGVTSFAKKYKDYKFNFLLMGVEELPKQYISQMDSADNLFYKLIPLKLIVPKAIFSYSDVVIATAGCANISYKEGSKTISYNVETNSPLGVMGYTTINSVVDNNGENNCFDLATILDEVLIQKLYTGPYTIQRATNHKGYDFLKGYDFQLTLINNDREYWPDVDKIVLDTPIRTMMGKAFLRLNGIKLLSKIIHSKAGKVIKR